MSETITADSSTADHSPARLVLAGFASGLLANFLLWQTGLLNAGFAVWLALFIIIAFFLLRDAGATRLRILSIWSAVALCAALVLVIRSTEPLLPLMWLVMLSAATIALMQIRGMALRESQVSDFLMALLKMPVHTLAGFPQLLRSIDYPRISSNMQVQGIVRGTLIALPLLLVFTLLFASADAGFSRLLPNASWLFSSFLPGRLALILIVSWIATGLFQSMCSSATASLVQSTNRWQLGTLETTVIMGLLSVLFLLFVVLQLGYLFGGTETIMATTGLTLAEYARRGFFELLAVAGLTLVVLLVLGAVSGMQRLYRRLGALLVLCVLIILASAAQRMYLYMDAYGLTLDRVIAVAFMVWLATSLLLFSATILRGKTSGFAAGIYLSGIAIVLLLALANPAGLVTTTNIDRAVANRNQDSAALAQQPGPGDTPVDTPFNGNREIDIDYLLSLGSDAVPGLLSRLENLDVAEQCQVAGYLLQEWQLGNGASDNRDWRSWNASRAQARKAVFDMAPQLQQKVSVFTDVIETTIPNQAIQRMIC